MKIPIAWDRFASKSLATWKDIISHHVSEKNCTKCLSQNFIKFPPF